MHPHVQLAKQLNCSRLIVDKALMMLNITISMGYLSIDEKCRLIEMLIEQSEQTAVDRAFLENLLKKQPKQHFHPSSQAQGLQRRMKNLKKAAAGPRTNRRKTI